MPKQDTPTSRPEPRVGEWAGYRFYAGPKPAPIAVVTGSRNLKVGTAIRRALDEVDPGLVVHGGADGADSWAHMWAVDHACPVLVVPAPWKQLGRRAGPVRNEWMLSAADRIAGTATHDQRVIVLAFPLGKSPGTRGCVEIARRRGFEVREFYPLTPPKEPTNG